MDGDFFCISIGSCIPSPNWRKKYIMVAFNLWASEGANVAGWCMVIMRRCDLFPFFTKLKIHFDDMH